MSKYALFDKGVDVWNAVALANFKEQRRLVVAGYKIRIKRKYGEVWYKYYDLNYKMVFVISQHVSLQEST